jgi:hypothetical protein
VIDPAKFEALAALVRDAKAEDQRTLAAAL